MAPIIHIGPPGTGTALIQEAVIPHVGRAYAINPAWTKRFARNAAATVPRSLPSDILISDESLGDFAVSSPQVVADRLVRLCGGARLIYVRRDPLDLFYAYYRQRLLDNIAQLRAFVSVQMPKNWPYSPSQFFDSQHKAYRRRGIGFFAMISWREIAMQFGRYFDFRTLEFDLLRTAPEAFARTFAAECGSAAIMSIPATGITPENEMDVALAPMAPRLPTVLVKRLRDYYGALLSEDQERMLRDWDARGTRWPKPANVAVHMTPEDLVAAE